MFLWRESSAFNSSVFLKTLQNKSFFFVFFLPSIIAQNVLFYFITDAAEMKSGNKVFTAR